MIQAETVSKCDLSRKRHLEKVSKLNEVMGILNLTKLIDADLSQNEKDPKIRFLDLKVDLRFDIPVKVWIDCFEGAQRSSTCFQCLFLLEPDIITNASLQASKKIDRFDAVFAHDPRILRALPRQKTYLFEHGGTWILPEKITSHSLDKKLESGCVSFVCGGKRKTRGHRLRHEIWKLQTSIKRSRRKFYISGAFGHGVPRIEGDDTLILDAKPEAKCVLFEDDIAFHVCIENVRQKNYFSEKLLDCFLTHTIPLYWGCPNIDSYFDVRGMILLGKNSSNVAKETIETINNLLSTSPKVLRMKMKDAIEENFQRAKQWINLEKRMQIAIERAIYVRGG